MRLILIALFVITALSGVRAATLMAERLTLVSGQQLAGVYGLTAA